LTALNPALDENLESKPNEGKDGKLSQSIASATVGVGIVLLVSAPLAQLRADS
jgi:hypothetical protein